MGVPPTDGIWLDKNKQYHFRVGMAAAEDVVKVSENIDLDLDAVRIFL